MQVERETKYPGTYDVNVSHRQLPRRDAGCWQRAVSSPSGTSGLQLGGGGDVAGGDTTSGARAQVAHRDDQLDAELVAQHEQQLRHLPSTNERITFKCRLPQISVRPHRHGDSLAGGATSRTMLRGMKARMKRDVSAPLRSDSSTKDATKPVR